MIALCLRKDMGWIASGAPPEYHADEQADQDIPDQTIAVREFFRQHGSAFFDDVVAATGVEEGPALRAVWHLVWCGELTCDTYECLRHADFEVTLSACYDLMSTPRKIVSGREPAERVVERMRKRKLEPRLGRWTATERLVPPVQPLPEIDIVRRWVHLLLKRWGIVSKDILDCEVAAPPWAVLVRELKRLELLGKVSRGYFIESHQGEQYGLSEAIELLRDCRARRSDGQELGYLPDEPIFAVSNRDPANLYTSSLEIVEERGDALKRHQRQGSFTERAVVQAGQVLLFAHGDPIQLVTLTRRQLTKCIEQLTHNYAGRAVKATFGKWNGHPIDASPVASLLWDLGFRFDNRGRLCWPPTTPGKKRPPESKQDLFPPHYEEASPVDYGPAHTVSRAPEGLRATLSSLFDVLLTELDREGWVFNWKEDWPRCIYRDGLAQLAVVIRQRWANVWVRTRHLRVDGRPRQFRWGRRIEAPGELDEVFAAELRTALGGAEEFAARIAEAKGL